MLIHLGLDFRGADLAIRERFHILEDQLPARYEIGGSRPAVLEELVLVATCNRTEAYGWIDASVPSRVGARALARAWVRDATRVDELLKLTRVRCGMDVADHLLRVAAGLESQILGDIHILGQVRRAFRAATRAEATGRHLHRLFEIALRTGKEVKRDTDLMAGRSSVGTEAVAMARRVRSGLEDQRCVLVGCGKVGSHAAEALVEAGAGSLTLVNRSPEPARRLAAELGASTAPLESLYGVLAEADVVVVATGAPTLVVEALPLARARRANGGTRPPLLVMDVTMPRNVDPALGDLPGVELMDLDRIHPEASSVEEARRDAVPQAEAVVERHVGEYGDWLAQGELLRALTPFRAALDEICRREMRYSAESGGSWERAADRIVAKLMARPMTALRDTPDPDTDVRTVARTLTLLFGDETSPESHRAAGA